MSLDVARRLLGKPGVDLIQLTRGRHLRRARRLPHVDSATLGSDYITQDWADMNRSLFYGALAREDRRLAMAIGLIVMVAALNIVASLDPARDGEAPRHRDPEDHGRERAGA